jgi:hypothetical protein
MLNTHRSRNQPSGTTLPEGRPKSPESKENLLETGTSGNNIILQGRKATIGFRRDHQSQPDERVQYTGRHCHNINSCWRSEIPRSNQISNEDR